MRRQDLPTSPPLGQGASALTGDDSREVLLDLLEALRVPGAIHPGLAASVGHSARELLDGHGPRRGTAFDGRLTAIRELPSLACESLFTRLT